MAAGNRDSNSCLLGITCFYNGIAGKCFYHANDAFQYVGSYPAGLYPDGKIKRAVGIGDRYAPCA